jgi:hypothetical protein
MPNLGSIVGAELHDKVRDAAATLGISANEFVREAVEEKLKKNAVDLPRIPGHGVWKRREHDPVLGELEVSHLPEGDEKYIEHEYGS